MMHAQETDDLKMLLLAIWKRYHAHNGRRSLQDQLIMVGCLLHRYGVSKSPYIGPDCSYMLKFYCSGGQMYLRGGGELL